MIWTFRPWPHVAELRPLVEGLGVSPLAASVIWNRGFRTAADLEPPLELLPLEHLKTAALRVVEALERRERIRIHGDYDADGLTGTAVLLNGLGRLGADIHAFIPHRLGEGYGVLMDRVAEHVAGCDLFITVDCGISNHAEIAALKADGVTVIVTDHHSPGAVLPDATLVHPMLSPRLEGLPHPTGAGVAFVLLWQVYELLGKDPPLEFADLAAIGTVADVAPLQGFNRALVKEGLRRLRNSAHVGLAALAAEHCKDFTSTEIAFRVAPRINASSRLGQAEVALRLLTSRDMLEVRPIAEHLSQLNAQRQRIEEAMIERVLPTVDASKPALVVHDADGHPGVMGIVASRLLERFYKPVYIIADGKGSVRSTPGISAVGGLRFAADHLKRYGGHAAAAGFAISDSEIPAFTQAIHTYAAQFPVPVPQITLDGWLDGEDLADLQQALELLQPVGEGNPEPMFYAQGKPEFVRTLSEGKHLSFRMNGTKVIKWRDNGENLPQRIDLAAGLVINEWNGERTVELRGSVYRALSDELSASWLEPAPFAPTVKWAQEVRPRVYVAPEAAGWFVSRGIEVVAPDEAEVWFSLPPLPVLHQGVKVALSDKALGALEAHPDRLSQSFGRRIAAAYRRGQGRLMQEALERWWEAQGGQWSGGAGEKRGQENLA